eukprot:1322079-Amorphochlora_amoeboformis.AAC.3
MGRLGLTECSDGGGQMYRWMCQLQPDLLHGHLLDFPWPQGRDRSLRKGEKTPGVVLRGALLRLFGEELRRENVCVFLKV